MSKTLREEEKEGKRAERERERVVELRKGRSKNVWSEANWCKRGSFVVG